MPQNSCCVPGCAVVRKDGAPLLHKFPNPETSVERLKTWILNIGGEIGTLDHHTIYAKKRVCNRHFAKFHIYPTGRMSKLAIPTLHIPGSATEILHKFPNPNKQPERFRTWVYNIGGSILGLDNDTIFKRRRVCHLHFEARYHTRSKFVSFDAIPRLCLSGKELDVEGKLSKPALDSTNIEALTSKPALDSTNIDAIISKPAPDSTKFEDIISTPALDSRNIEAVVSKPSLDSTNIEAIRSKPALTSTLNVLRTQPNDLISVLCPKKTYAKQFIKVKRTTSESDNGKNTSRRAGKTYDPGVPLTTKVAVEYLLSGKLKTSVCRYCLKVTVGLSELDQIMQVAGTGVMYKVTVREIIACFYPFKARQEESFPEKICQRCIDRAINAYLFTQQCEQAERALQNCFDDMNEKFNKLDPLDRKKKRGRQKLHPNTNILYAEHHNVMDYAEPLRNIINLQTESLTNEPAWNEFECKKCWQVLPDLETLLNHEQIHSKYMWYHCRLCGKSFVKINQLKKHFNHVHVKGKGVPDEVDKTFKCKECGNVTENYVQHLQHIEKHKFKTIMKHLVEKKTDQLCLVCLKKSTDLVELDKMVCIHGSCPELVGDTSLYTVLASTLPDMNYLHNFIGTKICEKCLNHAITSYVFIHQFNFTRERLDLCVSLMLDNLSKINSSTNIFVQVSPPIIMPPQQEADESLLLDENDVIDESQLKIEVLEDEYRIKTESESEPEETYQSSPPKRRSENSTPEMENLASNATKTYLKRKVVNGLQSSRYSVDVCSEFLTFNKRKKVERVTFKFTCPLCSKHFISKYFLKRHILKHMNKRVYCNICHDVFKSKFYLYEHTKMAHLLKESFYMSCKECGRNFTDTDKLQTHEESHRIKPCELCNKVYTTQAHFENHIQRHAIKLKRLKEKQIQTCSFCEKECSNDNELSVHVNKIHLQIKPYSCDMCDRQFYTESNLWNHKKVHSMPSKEKCEFCSKTLGSRKQLVIHVRKHIGAKPFSCQVCGQAFYSAYKVREHMRQSHGGRFCCRICKSIFVTKYQLKEHVSRDHNII